MLYSILSLLYTLLSLTVAGTGIYILGKWDYQNISSTTKIILSIIIILLGIILFIMFFLLLTQKFVFYIRHIAEGINEISLGNLEHRIIINNEDEFALIAEKLNKMADDIKAIMESKQRSEEAKKQLITSVAHDLRTPLTSIIGYLELVSSKELPPEINRKYVEIAYNKSKRLENLIEDLFTYTKFNFGEVKPVYTQVDIIKLINQLLDEFYPSFQEFNLKYEFDTEYLSMVILADGNLLARALANLISNAIKYGKDGGLIQLNLSKTESGIILSIINYGEVIPKKDLDLIFQRFYRVENSRSRETGGSGLGLAIAESIISMHNGTIRATSDVTGTEFIIELPYE